MMQTPRKTRSCSNSRNGGENNSETFLPFDLVIEILTRCPAKSVARFRCLSKLYASTLDNPNFTDTFFTMSLSRPKLLFTCSTDGETFFFSSPKPHDSSPLAVNFHMSFPVNRPFDICRPVCGFVYGFKNHKTLKGRTVSMPLICNPSTGQSWPLPRVKTNRIVITSYFGYDPIDKEFKVLCMTRSQFGAFGEHQVLTLTTGKKLSWRKINCDLEHSPSAVEFEANHNYPLYDGICINGVLYYLDRIGAYGGCPDIVCFDVKSEKFSYIKKAHGLGMQCSSGSKLQPNLVNYKGKIAKFQPNRDHGNIITGIQLWVVEDAEKHEWSSYIYVLPHPWKNIIEEAKLRFVGTSDTGEIVLSPYNISDSFYLLYYNPERNTITRVEIQGMEAFKSHKAYAFLDHVENIVKLKPCS